MVPDTGRGEEHYPCYRIDERNHRRLVTFTHMLFCTLPHHSALASCCNEAFKIATSSAPYLDNYFMYIGTDGVYSYTFKHERREDCPVCGGESMAIEVGKEWTVDRLIEVLVERQDM